MSSYTQAKNYGRMVPGQLFELGEYVIVKSSVFTRARIEAVNFTTSDQVDSGMVISYLVTLEATGTRATYPQESLHLAGNVGVALTAMRGID